MTLPVIKSEDEFTIRLESERLSLVHEVAQRSVTHYGPGAELQQKADALSWVIAAYNDTYDELRSLPPTDVFLHQLDFVISLNHSEDNLDAARKEGFLLARDIFVDVRGGEV